MANNFGGFLSGCTGAGTGAGRLWYMRIRFPISLLGWGRGVGSVELPRTTSLPGVSAGCGVLADGFLATGGGARGLSALGSSFCSTLGGSGGVHTLVGRFLMVLAGFCPILRK